MRVLVTEGVTSPYARTFESFTPDPVGLAQALQQVVADTRLQFDRAHLIIPSEEVTVSRYKIPTMPLADAEKVVRRKLAVEFSLDDPVFHLTPLDMDKRQRTYMVELVKADVIQRYVKLLSVARLKIKTVTSSFNANIRCFRGASPEVPETSAVFDIDNEAIEVTVLSHAEVIYAERIPLTYPGEDQERSGEASADRVQKMKLYRIMDAIYKVHLSYQELYPDNAVQKIWLCGLRGGAEGVSDALRQAMDAEIVSGDDSRPEGYAYTALFGLSEGLADNRAINFATKKSLRQINEKTVRLLTTLAVSMTLISMLCGYVVYENKYIKERTLLEKAEQEQKARHRAGRPVSPYLLYREQISGLEKTQVAYYDILRFIANRIPDGIILEKITFKQEQTRGMLDLVFLAAQNPKTGKNNVLTKLTTMLGELEACRRHREPVITVVTKEKEKVLRTEFRCEVYTLEKKN